MKQTSKRPLLPAVTACLLGIVVALWTCSAFGPAATDGATPADAGSHDGTRPAAAPATAATSAAERTPAAPSGPLLTVRVEDRLDGAWLPGAVVFHREVPDLAALRTHAGRAAEASITERLGRTLVADAQGRVQVPIDHAVQLVGRSGDRYGTLGLGVADAGDLAQVQRLRLDRDVALRVRVVDHRDERAARMPLELLPAGADSGAAPLELATDDDGLCAIGHWQDFAREAGYGRGGVDRVVVRCAGGRRGRHRRRCRTAARTRAAAARDGARRRARHRRRRAARAL
jgi:hypothetical protein